MFFIGWPIFRVAFVFTPPSLPSNSFHIIYLYWPEALVSQLLHSRHDFKTGMPCIVSRGWG